MRSGEALSEFVREALDAGHPEARIREALRGQGWVAAEIDAALAGWARLDGLPAVPRPRAHVSGREAIMYALLLIALAMVCWHLVMLWHGLVDAAIPDVTDPHTPVSQMRFSIAALIAFLPLFLWLDRRLALRAVAEDARGRGAARRGFALVTVLIAAIVLLSDLVAIIHAALSGDLTLRFAAKALALGLIGALVLVYYKDDLDG